jgi:hypothetical protein
MIKMTDLKTLYEKEALQGVDNEEGEEYLLLARRVV